MKRFKKVISLFVMLVMVIAMGVCVNAADPESGSVTVNPNFEGQTYTLYKLFDAEITWKDDGTVRAINYKLPAGKTDLGAGSTWFKIENGYVVAQDGLAEGWAKSPAAITWAKSFGSQVGSPIVAASDNDANVKWEGLNFGYYFVDSTLGAFIGVDTSNPDVVIEDKNEPSGIDKEITGVGEDKDTSSLGTGDDVTDIGNGANEKAIAQVGDPVSYKLTVKAKPGAENYVVTDTMTNLELVANSVTINGTAYASSTIVDKTESQVVDKANSFKIVFTKAYLDTITANTDIIIEYTATITEDAVIGEEGNPNTSTLTWGHKTVPDSDEDDAKVYVAKISLLKKDENNTPLAGAEFALKNAEGKYYYYDETAKAVKWVTSVDDATKYTTGDDGLLTKEFTGLNNGQYVLEETVVPAGYTALDPDDDALKFTIADTDYTDANLIQDTEVENKSGSLLPSTGGMGTRIFYILGAVLVIGAGVLLVTRRRMA